VSEPFLAEIKVVAFDFPPRGWALCNGQLLPINQNQALFSILGTTYGGDGRVTFALPDLRSRTPIHVHPSFPLGTAAGEETHILTVGELPGHTHAAAASSNPATTPDPAGGVWADPGQPAYAGTADTTMASAATGPIGGSQPHDNMSPYLVLNFIIALVGIFPSPN